MPTIDPDELESFAATLLETLGAPPDVAGIVAESLAGADRRGHASHGVIRIPWYAEMIEAGELNPAATPEIEFEDGAAARVAGNRAFGQAVGRLAVEVAVSKVSDAGAGLVGVADATHLGRMGEWAERAAAEGLCFAAFVNTGGGLPTVAPPGSARRTLATNPVAFGVPTFGALDFPIVLDAATSQVAHGKIKAYASAGRPLPPGWTTDGAGEPVRDGDAFAAGEGALLPLGGETAGYKGFGLALVAELFAAVVSGGPVAGERESAYPNNAGCLVAFDPTRFAGREEIEARVSALASHVRAATGGPPGPGAFGDQYLLPGEPEHRAERESRESGVELSAGVAESLRDLAARRGVADAVPAALADR